MNNYGDKRRQILLAALDVFNKDGFYKAKVSDIAKTANVGKGTIYEYFDSKDNLFDELIKYCIEERTEKSQQMIKKEETVIRKLKTYINLEIESINYYGNLINVILQGGAKFSDRLKANIMEYGKSKTNQLEEIFKEGISQKIFRDVNINTVSLLFIGGVTQMIMEGAQYTKEIEELDIKIFLDVFLNGIKK